MPDANAPHQFFFSATQPRQQEEGESLAVYRTELQAIVAGRPVAVPRNILDSRVAWMTLPEYRQFVRGG